MRLASASGLGSGWSPETHRRAKAYSQRGRGGPIPHRDLETTFGISQRQRLPRGDVPVCLVKRDQPAGKVHFASSPGELCRQVRGQVAEMVHLHDLSLQPVPDLSPSRLGEPHRDP